MLAVQRGRVSLAIVMTLAASGLPVLAPIPVKLVIDGILEGHRHGWPMPHLPKMELIALLALASAVLATLSAVSSAIQKQISARISERMTMDLRLICLDRLMLLTPLCRAADRSGELGLRLVDDVQQVARLFTRTGPVILNYGLIFLFTLIAMLLINPWLGLIATLTIVMLGLMVRFAARPLNATSGAKRRQEGKVAGAAQEILRSLSFIQASGAERDVRIQFANLNRASLAAGVAESWAAVRLERTMQIARGLVAALILGGGGLLAVQGHLSAGSLTITVIYLNQMLRPLEKINDLASAVTGATSRAARLTELLDRHERLDRSGTFKTERARGLITLASPEFAYEAGRAFHFDDITLPARAFISIEGPSGAGKSTLLALLTRLFDPVRGVIRLDEHDYQDWDLASLRAQFAISPQAPPLMSGTVRSWLTMGGVTADDTGLWKALKAVSLAETLLARGGLDAALGEAGAGFSGGEQARLALARALAADRPILLLDEPFANVDPASAGVMLEALAREKGRRTIVIVTHQPLPEHFADVRLRMEAGRLSQLEARAVKVSA